MRDALLAAGAALALVGSSQAQETQPDPYRRRDVQVGAFRRLEVSGPFKVGVLVGGRPAPVRFSGPPALLADAVAKLDGDTLQIGFRDGAGWSWNPGSGVNVLVSAPDLASARATGAAEVEIHRAHGDAFSASVDGSGGMNLDGVDVGRVTFAIGGAGGITAEGRARQGTYAVGGAGSIDAKRLRVETASIAVGGSGSIHADVSRLADVAVGGSGRVDVVGGATCVRRPADSPRIECR